MHTVTRYHDFSAGHRVVGHEGKCRYLHGHNYRVHFTCATILRSAEGPSRFLNGLDDTGRVIDFSVINERLCQWLEDHWDHRFLVYEEDKMMLGLLYAMGEPPFLQDSTYDDYAESLVVVPFNPTAENMARYLVETVGPIQLEGTGVELIQCVVEETRKCSATYIK